METNKSIDRKAATKVSFKKPEHKNTNQLSKAWKNPSTKTFFFGNLVIHFTVAHLKLASNDLEPLNLYFTSGGFLFSVENAAIYEKNTTKRFHKNGLTNDGLVPSVKKCQVAEKQEAPSHSKVFHQDATEKNRLNIEQLI